MVADALAILVALGATGWAIARSGTNTLDWPAFPIAVPYTFILPITGVAWLMTLTLTRKNERWVAGVEEFRRVITMTFGIFGLIAIGAYLAQANLSRLTFAVALPLGLALLLLGRVVCRAYLTRRRRQGLDLDNALVVANSATADATIRNIIERPLAGFRVTDVALVDEFGVPGDEPKIHPDEVVERVRATDVSAVIVGPGLDPDYLRELAWALEDAQVSFLVTASLMDVTASRIHTTPVQGLNLIHVDLPRMSTLERIAKRLLDITFSAAVMVAMAPIFLAIALSIRLDSPGPAVFKQQRIGLNGKPFTIHKFRTMVTDAESKIDELIAANGDTALRFKLKDDPRITRVGAWLRRTSLDELPQFWDALRGHMSVVGPRPQVEREVAEYNDAMRRRLLVKPGITGLWQINGRNDLSEEQATRWDLYYVENWSLAEDLAIILKTVRVVLKGSGAY